MRNDVHRELTEGLLFVSFFMTITYLKLSYGRKKEKQLKKGRSLLERLRAGGHEKEKRQTGS